MESVSLSPILPAPLRSSDADADESTNIQAASADFESFLTLLTAQLRNQDPLSPLDSTEFVAQLASFSSVEQLIGTNTRLDALANQSLNGDIASFAAWIGRSVTSVDGGFRATGAEIEFSVPQVAAADKIEAAVIDATTGSVIRTFDLAPNSNNNAIWDGEDQLGNLVAPRDLKLELRFFEGGSISHTAPAEVFRKVSGIRGTESGLLLDLADGGALAPESVGRLIEAPTTE